MVRSRNATAEAVAPHVVERSWELSQVENEGLCRFVYIVIHFEEDLSSLRRCSIAVELYIVVEAA